MPAFTLSFRAALGTSSGPILYPRSRLVRPSPGGWPGGFPQLVPWLAAACAGMARAATQRRSLPRVDSHLHLWTPDTEKYPCVTPPPEHLNKDGRGTFENFVKLMDESGVASAVVVQPINYGQDYRYLTAAMNAHPDRLRGVFVADASTPPDGAREWIRGVA